ncbi:FtsX-like permease family protein [Candidatus Dojkabacteria bacterium]|nr:FtsX-like permease family protein [Candidatus Dojkabacteria bacterium]
MNIVNSFYLNIKKLFSHKKKAMFLIIPVALLVGLSIVITSEAKNILKASEESIFGTLTDQALTLELTKQPTFQRSGEGGGSQVRFGQSSSTEENFSSSDVDKIESIDGVINASILSTLPISRINTTSLFENISTSVNQLVGIDKGFASQYTVDDFSYTEGRAIPIVINANDFMQRYEDWQGKESITVKFEMRRPGEGAAVGSSGQNEDSPVKTKAIDYEKKDLIGKEIILEIGGLDEIQTFTTEPGNTGMIFTRLTEDEIAQNEADRIAAISPYWDYEKINTPMAYTFKVVGLIENAMERSSYIPEEAASELMKGYIQNQIEARTSKTLDTDLLNNNFTGMTYDGLSLSSGSGFNVPKMGRMVGFGSGNAMNSSDSNSESYAIPGLVIEFDDEGNVVGEINDVSVYDNSAITGTTIFIRVKDIYSRTDVIHQLNDLGYAYQDLSDLDVIDELKSTLSTVVLLTSIVFIGLSIVVTIFTMGKFVSEAKREIGIHRALGMTKSNIRILFISQAVLYTLVGYVIGAAGGIATTIGLSGAMNIAFNNFLSKTLEEAFSVVNPVDSSIFNHIDWQMFGLYSILLFVIAITISLIPANHAANTSPVEAIRGE